MSGKPIIYCANTKLDYVPVYRTIIDCSYIADSFSEVRQYVKQLLEGNDPLRDRREKEAEKLFQERIQLAPNDTYARLELGKLYAEQGKAELINGIWKVTQKMKLQYV